MIGIFNNTTPLLLTIGIIIAIFAIAISFFIGFAKGKESNMRSKKITRSVLGGVFSEQVAPFLPDFPKDLKASEARFIGKPVDFIIFKGMDEQSITEIVFVEVKSGSSHLTSNQRNLRDAIIQKRVRWHEYHVPDQVAKMGEASEPVA